MAKQLYYSEIYSKFICLSLHIETYNEVHDVIKYKTIASVNSSGRITNYVMCASGCFCVTKGTRLSTSFVILLGTQKEKGRPEG